MEGLKIYIECLKIVFFSFVINLQLSNHNIICLPVLSPPPQKP
jgi:hypothetical protein